MEYITKKVPKEADEILKYVQAHEQLEKGERVSEAQVLYMTLKHYAEEKYGYKKKSIKKGLGIEHLVGIFTSGTKTSWKDIDKIVYGV